VTAAVALRLRQSESFSMRSNEIRVLLRPVFLSNFLRSPDYTRLADEVWELAQVDGETLLSVASSVSPSFLFLSLQPLLSRSSPTDIINILSFPCACQYISALLGSGRASEVPQVIQLLLDRNVLGPNSTLWPFLISNTALGCRDWVGAARLVLDLVRTHGSEEDVLRSIARLRHLAKRPDAQSAGPKIKEARVLLESELGVEVWEKAKTVKKPKKGGSS
jgi:hypothetical protein